MATRRLRQLRRPAREGGAIGLSMAVVLLTSLLFLVLAVDTGRLALEKRKLQRIADLSALHAAGVAVCGGSSAPTQATVAAAAQAVAAQNGYGGDLSSETGAVTLGTITTASGVRAFTPAASAADADSVRVVASGDFPSSLIAGALYPGETRLQTEAVARKQLLAGFQLGSFLARLNTGDSILNPLLGGLLGSAVTLDLASYKGIAAAQVSLLNLIEAAPGIGTVDELLTTPIGVGGFLDLLADAVAPGSTAELALNQLRLAYVGGLPAITLGEVLAVTGSDPEAALDATVNAFDLLTASLQLANKDHAVSVPGINLNLAPLATLGLGLYVVEPPKIAIGPPGTDSDGHWRTEVQTAQVRLQLDLTADPLDIPILSLLGALLGQIHVDVRLSLYLDAAAADAHLTSIQCPTVADPQYHVTVGVQPSVASLGVGQYSNMAGSGATQPTPTLEVTALGLTVASVTISASTSVQNPTAKDLVFDVDRTPIPAPPPPELTRTAGTDPAAGIGHAIADLSNLHVDVEVLPDIKLLSLLAKLLVEPILDTLGDAVLKPLLQSLLSVVGSAVLNPLLAALGVQLGGADVTLILLQAQPTLLAI